MAKKTKKKKTTRKGDSDTKPKGKNAKAPKRALKKKKIGRPTRYKPSLCKALIDYFDIEPWEEREIPHYKAGDVTWTDFKLMPNRLPTLRRFAKAHDIAISTIYNWCDPNHTTFKPDFMDAFTCAKEIRKEILIDAALAGLTPPLTFKFVAINMTDMRDKSETALTGEDGGPIKTKLTIVVGDANS